MKQPKPDSLNRPFAGLKDLLRKRAVRLEPGPEPARPTPPAPAQPGSDDELFAEAMGGVSRIDWNSPEAEGRESPPPAGEAETHNPDLAQLRSLIDCGSGFLVSDTPEYMEGVGYQAPPEITRRLHRGDFAVQAHVDLHGLSVPGAQETFDAFMRESVQTGKRAILIIHGRGLSSPAEPVLKTKVAEWLTYGPWRKWVVAFTSARLCDGGSGASYVLLRHRPVTKKFRKRRRHPGLPS